MQTHQIAATAASVAAIAVIYMVFIRTTTKVNTKPKPTTPRRPVYVDKNPDLVHSLGPGELYPYDYWGDLASSLVVYAMPNSYGWALDMPRDKPVMDTPSQLCIVTTAVGIESPLIHTAVKNKQAYADKHGYSFHVYTDKEVDPKGHPKYYKIEAIKLAFQNKHCKWVFYMDGTAVFNNHNILLSDFIVDVPNRVKLVLSWDGDNYKKIAGRSQETRMYHQLHTGAFFVRNERWSKEFLEDVLRAADPDDREVYRGGEDRGAFSEVVYQRGATQASKYLWMHRRAWNKMYGKWSQANEYDFVYNYQSACVDDGNCAGMDALIAAIGKRHS